jgi:hypothetical protein
MKTPLVRWLAAMILALCPQGWCLCATAGDAPPSHDVAPANDRGCCERCPQSQPDQDTDDGKPCGQCDGSLQPRASFDDVKPAAVTLTAVAPLAGSAADDHADSFSPTARAPLICRLAPQTLLQLHCALVI